MKHNEHAKKNIMTGRKWVDELNLALFHVK